MVLDCFEHKFYFFCKKITNFLDITSDDQDLPRIVTKKWIEVQDQSGGNYNANKEIRIKTSMPRSDLRDYSDAYTVVKGDIIVVKKIFTAADFQRPILQILMHLILIMKITLRLVKKNQFLKIMHHLSIVFKTLTE